MFPKLSVNVNKIALVRNSRGKNLPNLLQMSLDILRFGADGITVHPRPDGRHIRAEDVVELKQNLTAELNVEGYPSPEFMDMVLAIRPAQVTLVPDPPHALTSSAGWNTQKAQYFLLETIKALQEKQIRTSIFVEPDLEMIEGAANIGTDRIELYTEAFAHQFATHPAEAVEPYVRAAGYAHELGLGINAGHDLNQQNLSYFVRNVPNLAEVSIGHALVCDALYEGMSKTIANYKACIEAGRKD